jgi:hypothetical protein
MSNVRKGNCMKSSLLLMGLMVALSGCVRLKTEPIRVEPIEITMNVNLRVVQELTEFFDELDAQSTVMGPLPLENPEPSEE